MGDAKYENGWNPNPPTGIKHPLPTRPADVCIHGIKLDVDRACTECNIIFQQSLILVARRNEQKRLKDFKKDNPNPNLQYLTSPTTGDTYVGHSRVRAYSGRMMELSVLKYEDEHKRDLSIIFNRCKDDLEAKLGYVHTELEKLK